MKVAVALCTLAVLAFQTSQALAQDDADAQVARAQFASPSSYDEIGVTVCNLVGAAQVGDRTHPFDMRLGDRRCTAKTPMADDAVAVRVNVEPREGYGQEVIVEIDASEDVPMQEARNTVTAIARELRARIPRHPLYPPSVSTPETKNTDSGVHTFGIVSVALGGLGLGGGAVVGVGSLIVGAAESFGCSLSHLGGGSGGCSSNASGGLMAAGVMLGVGSAFMITGIVCLNIGAKKKVTAYATPSGGGIRVAF